MERDTSPVGYPALIVAQEMKLFELLAEKPLTLANCDYGNSSAFPGKLEFFAARSQGLYGRQDHPFEKCAWA